MPVCPNCQSTVETRFCPDCGARIVGEPALPSDEQAPPIYTAPPAAHKSHWFKWPLIGCGGFLALIGLVVVVWAALTTRVNVNNGHINFTFGTYSQDRLMGSIVMTDAVDAVTQQPKREVTTFPSGTKIVYATAKIHAHAGAHFSSDWYLENEKLMSYDYPVNQSGELWISYNLFAKQRPSLPAGNYRVVISANGIQLGETHFSVQQ